ncbi:unnamed protein product [Clavelina lepadiformis]|uniref:Uncharacterized protein n=1 Tax=Clavelina lepadiformis TaxID=159417 RepID=A0ABP0GBR3_CLALP
MLDSIIHTKSENKQKRKLNYSQNQLSKPSISSSQKETPVELSQFKQRKRRGKGFYTSEKAARNLKFSTENTMVKKPLEAPHDSSELNDETVLWQVQFPRTNQYMWDASPQELLEIKHYASTVWRTPFVIGLLCNMALETKSTKEVTWLDILSCSTSLQNTIVTAMKEHIQSPFQIGWLTKFLVDSYVSSTIQSCFEKTGKLTFGAVDCDMTNQVLHGFFPKKLENCHSGSWHYRRKQKAKKNPVFSTAME